MLHYCLPHGAASQPMPGCVVFLEPSHTSKQILSLYSSNTIDIQVNCVSLSNVKKYDQLD